MTEQERLYQAKRWIDCLAQGIHPLTGEELPDDDVVNNVRVSRCLFFVSEVLRQDLANRTGSKTVPQKPFVLTLEEREQVVLSPQPIPATDLARRLNCAARTPGIKKIQYVHIARWLVEVGLLREVLRSDGRKTRRPTASGEKVGITVELRTEREHPYQVVVYSQEAQRFVLDNIDAIVAYTEGQK